MKKLSSVHSLMMMAAMFESLGGTNHNSGGNRLTPEKINVKPKPKLIPKGCKEFFISHEGQFYKVFALNKKSAEAKLLKMVKKMNDGK